MPPDILLETLTLTLSQREREQVRPRSALGRAVPLLESAGVEEPRLVAELLLAHALRCGRAQLYAHPDEPLERNARRRWRGYLRRALQHEPAAYVLRRREFYDLDFYVDRRVLIPRPETELLVEQAIAWARAFAGREGHPPRLADIGTGSGAIAVSLATQLPAARVDATDISPAALRVARRNARRHGVDERITFLPGNLLQPLPTLVDLVVANLPYVSDAELVALPPHIAAYEPRGALAGGPDGLDVVRALFAQVPARVKPGGALLLEVSASQGESAAALARATFLGAEVSVLTDLAGLPRMLRVQLA